MDGLYGVQEITQSFFFLGHYFIISFNVRLSLHNPKLMRKRKTILSIYYNIVIKQTCHNRMRISFIIVASLPDQKIRSHQVVHLVTNSKTANDKLTFHYTLLVFISPALPDMLV
jgi:hypothetical protein